MDHAEAHAEPAHQPSAVSASERSERFTPQKPLGRCDVACLIINKMIGGGIFVSPSIVAHLTGNKVAALFLWVFGGLYSFCSIYIYLEYGLAWPYNGGEFIYISKIFPVPPLLFACSFAWAFIAFATSTTNSITFAHYINPNKAEDPDVWFTKFFACVIVVAVSALHYRFVNIGIAANNLLAVFKVSFLAILIVGGIVESFRQGGSLPGLGDYPTQHGTSSVTNYALAILQVLYSYQGWENANYVTSEIRGEGVEKKRILKAGGLAAITIVVTLYISFNLVLFFVLDLKSITDSVGNVTADYAITVFRSSHETMASHAIYVCIALAAAGNIIGVSFTRARVNRVIAQHRLIPFHRFFAKSSKYGTTQWDHLGTPTGGLVLQALVTCVTIACVDPFRTILNLSTYGHAVACLILGIGVLFIRKRMDQYETKDADPIGAGYTTPWHFQVMKRPLIRYLAVIFSTVANAYLIIIPFKPTSNPDGTHPATPSWVQPTIVIVVYAIGAIVALYIITFVPVLDFRQSTCDIRQNPEDRGRFVDYNDRRWIIRYLNLRGDSRKTVETLFTPRSWENIKERLLTNDEAKTAQELRQRHPLREVVTG
ncbi:amino acid permease-domain-containing protein [Aspergillus cavernicola]|uniref:Amino acid permease-domain-containing protein n=1 Tax=Aspergillus cavernicola TaxID=176166 RepID=A0ABR4HYJ1_9EURO